MRVHFTSFALLVTSVVVVAQSLGIYLFFPLSLSEVMWDLHLENIKVASLIQAVEIHMLSVCYECCGASGADGF